VPQESENTSWSALLTFTSNINESFTSGLANLLTYCQGVNSVV